MTGAVNAIASTIIMDRPGSLQGKFMQNILHELTHLGEGC